MTYVLHVQLNPSLSTIKLQRQNRIELIRNSFFVKSVKYLQNQMLQLSMNLKRLAYKKKINKNGLLNPVIFQSNQTNRRNPQQLRQQKIILIPAANILKNNYLTFVLNVKQNAFALNVLFMVILTIKLFSLGIHKNHEVKTIKKAFSYAVEKLQNSFEQNQLVLDQINQQREEISNRQQEQNNIITTIRTQIQIEFQQIHSILVQKENQILEGLNLIPQIKSQFMPFLDGCVQIEEQIKQMSQKIYDILQSKEEVLSQFSYLKIEVLNFYASLSKMSPPKSQPLPYQMEYKTNQVEIIETLKQVKECIAKIKFQGKYVITIQILSFQEANFCTSSNKKQQSPE